MKIALVQAPLFGIGTPPLGVASLSAYMRSRGHEVLALDLNAALHKKLGAAGRQLWTPEKIEAFWSRPEAADAFAKKHRAFFDAQAAGIVAGGARLVGFSVCYSSLYFSLYLARRIKRLDKTIITVFGGPGASRHAAGRSIIEDACADFVVQGEGELTLAEIAENKKAKVFCKGTLIRRRGKVFDCGDRELIKDLDALPFPDFTDFDFNDYTEPFEIPILSSRGCCNSCNFCYERPYWGRFRARSGATIHKEVLHQLARHPGGKFFIFYDSLVNGNIRELEKFADLMTESRPGVFWGGMAVIRKEMTYKLFRKLKSSGCMGLLFGLETGSVPLMVKTGKLLARGADPDRIIRDGHRAGVYCAVNLMFGLPGETEADFEKTLGFIRRNAKYLGNVFPTSSFCIYPPGTDGARDPEKLGIVLTDENRWASKDGTNTYLTRLERCERFLKLAHDLKVPCDYPSPTLLGRNEMIARYHLGAGDIKKALPHLLLAVKNEGAELSAFERFESCCRENGLRGLYDSCRRKAESWKRGGQAEKARKAQQRFELERARNMQKQRGQTLSAMGRSKGGLK